MTDHKISRTMERIAMESLHAASTNVLNVYKEKDLRISKTL